MIQLSVRGPHASGLLLATLLAAPSLAAPQLYSKDPILQAHPAGYLLGDAREAVVGQLTDDVHPDVAILQGTDIALLYAAARHEAFLKLSGSYTELALMPGGGPGGRDALLAINSGGLVKVHWSGSLLARDSQFGTHAAWAGAGSLEVASVAGALHVTALNDAKTQILRGSWSGGSFTNLPPLALASNAKAYAALDLDTASTGAEYAVADLLGLKIYSNTGAVVASFSNPGNAPLVKRFRELGTAQEAVLWCTSVPGTQDQHHMFSVVRKGGSGAYGYEPFVPLWGQRVADIVLADWTGNGRVDLLGLSLIDDQVRIFENKWGAGAAPTYTFYLPDPGETFQIDGSDVYVGGASRPALAAGDLDGDGDADLVLAGHQLGSRSVGVYLGDGVDEGDLAPTVDPGYPDYTESLPAGGSIQAVLQFGLRAPKNQTTATHLQVALWVQPDWTSPVPATAAFAMRYPIPGTDVAVDVDIPLSFPVHPLGGWPEVLHAQFWAVREVGGQVVQAWPALTWKNNRGSFFTDPETTGGYNTPPNIQPGSGGTTRTP